MGRVSARASAHNNSQWTRSESLVDTREKACERFFLSREGVSDFCGDFFEKVHFGESFFTIPGEGQNMSGLRGDESKVQYCQAALKYETCLGR